MTLQRRPPSSSSSSTWLFALAFLAFTVSSTCQAATHAHQQHPILEIEELQEASKNKSLRGAAAAAADFQTEEAAIDNGIANLDAAGFQQEEMAIEQEENEQAIERLPVMEVAQEELVAQEEEEEEELPAMEAFLKEEADIENDSMQPIRKRRRMVGLFENLNQKTHKTAIGSFFHSNPEENQGVTENTGMHTNKVAQQVFFDEDMMDEMMATVMQMSMGR